jgi:catechol 2,3-dioxygenase-like lactoylglutathione lyase family enzyme
MTPGAGAGSGTRMYPLLPCRDIDEAIAFYEALGFARTYRQVRPNPHAVVERGELAVHLFGMDGFDPADSYGSVIITVPDPDELYTAFAAGLRAAYGRLPVAGIPRIVRPRKRWGTVYGFSVVDVGGNWLRISRSGARESPPDATEPGLAGLIEVSARLADAHGDEEQALKTLSAGWSATPTRPRLSVDGRCCTGRSWRSGLDARGTPAPPSRPQRSSISTRRSGRRWPTTSRTSPSCSPRPADRSGLARTDAFPSDRLGGADPQPSCDARAHGPGQTTTIG